MSVGAESQTSSSAVPDSSPAARWRPSHNQWAIALTVTLATFMEILDTSVANVALPHIAGGLSASVNEATWVLTSYLVANAIVLPMSAWMSTLLGRKRFYMGCVMLFTVSSFLCGVATSLGMLVFFRILQGAGGGGLAPSEQGILADTFEPERFGMAFAVYGMAVVLAPAIGPTLGGWITDSFSWRWIFFINIPVGAISLVLTYWMVEDPPYLEKARMTARRAGHGLDFTGLILLALIFGPLQMMLDKGEEDAWFESHFIAALGLIFVIALIVEIFWELRNKDPVVDLRLFRNRNFTIANMMMFAVGVILYSSTILIPVFLQVLMGYTAQQSGMVLSLGGVAIMVLMPLAGFLSSRIEARWLVAFGFLISALALYELTGISLNLDFRTAVILRIYQSIGLAFLFVPITTATYAGMPQEKNNQIAGISNLMRNVGGSIGIALTSALIVERSQLHQQNLVTHATAYSPAMRAATRGLGQQLFQSGASSADALNQAYGTIYRGIQAQAATLAYIDAFWVLAVLCAFLVPLNFIMRKTIPGSGPAIAH